MGVAAFCRERSLCAPLIFKHALTTPARRAGSILSDSGCTEREAKDGCKMERGFLANSGVGKAAPRNCPLKTPDRSLRGALRGHKPLEGRNSTEAGEPAVSHDLLGAYKPLVESHA